jgi:hypothetical protein
MTDQDCDPFGERARVLVQGPVQLLGCQYRFESNSRELLKLVEHAYAGLPQYALSPLAPQVTVRLLVSSAARAAGRSEPPPIQMVSGAGLLGGVTASGNSVMIAPEERSALIVVSPRMLRFPYHTRYELLEFAVFTLAVRVQKLASLHGACVGIGGRGVLLMGESGAGKSTVSLQCLLEGFEFLSEDSVFVDPGTLRAVGVPNFLHVRSDSLCWVDDRRALASIRKSPVIRRRSGVRKFEIDLRRRGYCLAPEPLQIGAIVFLSGRSAGRGPMLRALTRAQLLRRVVAEQGYATNSPSWPEFERSLARVAGFELRRGEHPAESAQALRELIALQG